MLVGFASLFYLATSALQVPPDLQGARPRRTRSRRRRGGRRARRARRCRSTRSSCRSTARPSVLPALVARHRGARLPEDEARRPAAAARRTTTRRSPRSRAMDLPPHFQLVVVPDAQPKTKPKACNYGLLQARGEYVVIFDAEDRPDPDQLKKVVVAFSKADPSVTCIQAKLNYFNPDQNLLTRWFTTEYSMWFDLLLPGLDAAGVADPARRHLEPLHHRAAARARRLGPVQRHRGRRPRHPPAQGRLPHGDDRLDDARGGQLRRSSNWIRQRSRWIKGYIQTWLVHMRHPLRLLRADRRQAASSLPAARRRHVHLPAQPDLLGADDAVLLHPGGLHPGSCSRASSSTLAACMLFVGNFVFMYLNVAGSIQRGLFGLAKYALLSPLYWGLMSIAAWKGFLQLFTTRSTGRRRARPRRSARPARRRRPEPHPWPAPARRPRDCEPPRRTSRVATTAGPRVADALPGEPGRRPAHAGRRRGAPAALVESLLVFAVAARLLLRRLQGRRRRRRRRLRRARPARRARYMVWHNDPPKLAAIGFVFPPLTTIVVPAVRGHQAARDVARRAAADVLDLRRRDGRRR